MTRSVVALLGAGVLAVSSLSPFACDHNGSTRVAPPRKILPGQSFTIAAAGDIAGPGQRHHATADLLESLNDAHELAAILPLGDLQYPTGELEDFRREFALSWGRPALRPLLRPVPGNHDYGKGWSTAQGYFDFFNGPGEREGVAGARGHGYYSFELGDWQLIALNTSDGCRTVSCGVTSPMYRWFERTLKNSERACTLVYFHHPRFHAAESHGDARSVSAIWELSYAHGVDVVLSGHAHNFQQLPPLNASGAVDNEHGIRSFVVGTGGASLHEELSSERQARGLEAIVVDRHGVLVLELATQMYGWQFVAPNGGQGEVLASGRDRCRAPRQR